MTILPVVVTSNARRDLAAIEHFTMEHWGSLQATEYVDALFAAFDRLALFPKIGTRADPESEGRRVLNVGHHSVIYQIDDTGITVLRILHHRYSPELHETD